MKVKPLDEIKTKYGESAKVVPERYRRAVTAVTDWKVAALEGQALYAEKMSDASVQGRRARAIERVSNEEWKSRALNIGAGRIGDGISKSVEKQSKGFAPYHATLVATDLPARTADPMANIDNRLKTVVSALVDKKKELLG